MTKLSWIISLAFLFGFGPTLTGQDSVKTSGSWSGVIINSGRTVDEAFAEAAKCTDNVRGARLVLYDDTKSGTFINSLRTEVIAVWR